MRDPPLPPAGLRRGPNGLQGGRSGVFMTTPPNSLACTPNRVQDHSFPGFLQRLGAAGESMPWLESAAFTLPVPAGCADDTRDLGGLSSFTCEMMLRGSGSRDSRQFIEDLDNLGVERSESVLDAHTRFGVPPWLANFPAALAIFADLVRRPHLPEDQFGSEPAGDVPGTPRLSKTSRRTRS